MAQEFPFYLLKSSEDKSSFQIKTHMSAALYTITKRWEQYKCPLTSEWIYKTWYFHIMEYYLAIKRTEVVIYTAVWARLKNNMLRGKSQSQKTTCHIIPFI